MFRSLRKISFLVSHLKETLVIDVDPIDVLVHDFSEEYLDEYVSKPLKIDYLSVCKQSREEILNKKVYKGIIVGHLPRLFVSIPTKFYESDKYYNVHYLLNTGSPITTLTQKALSALHQKEYKSICQPTLRQSLCGCYQIGSKTIRVHHSNSDQKSKTPPPFRNINVLGMNFFEFRDFTLKQNKYSFKFLLELDQNNHTDWEQDLI